MELCFDDFYEMYKPKKCTDLMLRSNRVINQLRKKFKNKKSFILLSILSNQGKHELVRNVSKEFIEVSLIDIYEDSSIDIVQENERMSFDMNKFLSNESVKKKKRTVFLVDETVVRNNSCSKLLNALIRSSNQCVLMCTSRNIKKDRKITRLIRTEKLPVIVTSAVPIRTLSAKIHEVSAMNRVLITRRASVNLAKRMYGNMRVFWKLLYHTLDNAKRKELKVTTSTHIIDIVKRYHTDSFENFADVLKRCSDTDVYSLEDRLNLCLGHSYALKHYCHRTVVLEKHCHPWNDSKKLDMSEIAEWTKLFSLSDRKGSLQYQFEELTLPLFLLT